MDEKKGTGIPIPPEMPVLIAVVAALVQTHPDPKALRAVLVPSVTGAMLAAVQAKGAAPLEAKVMAEMFLGLLDAIDPPSS